MLAHANCGALRNSTQGCVRIPKLHIPTVSIPLAVRIPVKALYRRVPVLTRCARTMMSPFARMSQAPGGYHNDCIPNTYNQLADRIVPAHSIHRRQSSSSMSQYTHPSVLQAHKRRIDSLTASIHQRVYLSFAKTVHRLPQLILLAHLALSTHPVSHSPCNDNDLRTVATLLREDGTVDIPNPA